MHSKPIKLTLNSANPVEVKSTPAPADTSSNIDRRTFVIRNAVIGAAAVMTGATWTPEARAAQAHL
jgi:L-serine dehydratase